MKQIVLGGFLFFIFSAFGQTHIVDNNPSSLTGVAVYSDFQSAHDAAAAGDTIHILPSPNGYGDITISKSLVIYGGGFNPDSDNQYTTNINILDLNNGSGGSFIRGLNIDQLRIAYEDGVYTLNDLFIEYCNIRYTNVSGAGFSARTIDSLVFRNDIFGNSNGGNITGGYIDLIDPEATVTAIYFYSSVIVGSNSSTGTISADTAFFYNNLIFGEGSDLQATAFVEVSRCLFENNTFYGRAPAANTQSQVNNSQFINNISSDSTFTSLIGSNGNTGSANLAYTDPELTNIAVGTQFSYAFDITPVAAGNSEGAGSDATDIGLTGGLTPYDPTGTPLPVVTNSQVPSGVAEGSNLTITINGKGN